MKVILLLAALLLFFVSAQEILDDFTDFGQLTASADGQTVEETVSGPGILGGSRLMEVTKVSGGSTSLEVSCTTVAGFFALSTDVTVIGGCQLTYAGPSGTGFSPPINFLQYGCDCWNMRILESDNNVGLEVVARSATAGDLISAATLEVDIAEPTDVCLPFDTSIENYQNIDQVDFTVNGNVANVDVNLNYVCCQPSLSCYHSIDPLFGADLDNLAPGNTIKLTLTCLNYISIPAGLERLRASFPFDSSIGTMDSATIMCTGARANGQTVANNALEFNSELADGEQVTCMVNVNLSGSGDVDDIQARILTDRSEPNHPILSHAMGDRSGTPDFCNPPVSSSLTVQNPPTTLPPTTLPPTTLPPTTLPPTTLPPTTLPPTTLPPTTLPPTTLPPTTLPPTTLPPTARETVCVSPRIINGECDCQTFPCSTYPDGSIHCETSEWYCWFITRVPTSGRFRVSYRGHMCYCDI